MRIGSLFSGIGGIELGLERAGLGPVVWQVESDAMRRGVLAYHWPVARRHDNIRTIEDLGDVDLICGGFPCQDISDAHTAAPRKGLNGKSSGLWREMRNVIFAEQPRWVLIENSGAWRRWLPVVRRELWDIGYASLPIRVHASDVGAPHRRPLEARENRAHTQAAYRECVRVALYPAACMPILECKPCASSKMIC